MASLIVAGMVAMNVSSMAREPLSELSLEPVRMLRVFLISCCRPILLWRLSMLECCLGGS